MGGNALKSYGTRRVNRETYDRIKALALDKLAIACSRCQVPHELRDKETYGDVDILCIIKPEFVVNWKQWLQDTFAPKTIIHNDNVWSFNIEDLQIDAISTNTNGFDIYYTFLCWGDLSMTLGRIARLYDLKYGIYGLEMPIRDPETNHVVAEAPISADPRKILTFLGYNYDRWLQGFSTQEELREFLFSSPRIHRGFMDARSEDGKHYKRDRKRSMYAAWHQWFVEHRMEFPERSSLPVPEGIDEKIKYIEDVFPESNLRVEYDRIQNSIRESTAARHKFSGSHIMKLYPELQGRAFGALMDLWTKQWPSKEAQVAYILAHDVEHLQELAVKVRAQLKL